MVKKGKLSILCLFCWERREEYLILGLVCMREALNFRERALISFGDSSFDFLGE